MLVDVHCHLDFPHFDPDREEVIRKCLDNDIIIVNSIISLDRLDPFLDLAKKYENVYYTIGMPPTELSSSLARNTLKEIEKHLATSRKFVGVGEVGLDYYWIKETEAREKEVENFHIFLDFIEKKKLPVVIHSRDAERDVINILRERNLKVLLHCFSGSKKLALEAVNLGYLISIPTSIAYSKQKQMLAKELPLENLVLETDSPFLAMKPKSRNEPINIKYSVEKIAKLKGIDKSKIEEVTFENSREFFNLKV